MGLRAQAAATVPLLDPAYDELARLEAFGLVPRGWVAQRPFSTARVAWIVRDARAWLASREDMDPVVRADIEARLERLERRFGPEAAARPRALVEVEAGGGGGPGHLVPDNGLGSVDAVVAPAWSYRGGRAYGDRAFGAFAGAVAVPIGSRFAAVVGGRVVEESGDGPWRGRTGASVESAYARASLGSFAIQVGRDAVSLGHGGREGLLLSDHAPPLDLVRLATDRPLSVWGLGDTELTLLAADLGPRQNFPHAKLFVAKISARPTQALELGLTALNKQGGEGAPEASTSERIKDLTFVWDLFRPGRDYVFSEKLVSLDFRTTLPGEAGAAVYGEVVVTDFDHHRLRDIVSSDGAYLLGLSLPRLGARQRHAVTLEGQWLGPTLYRHHQFRSGLTAERVYLGSELGPSGRGLRLAYAWDDPVGGWRLSFAADLEERSIDVHEVAYTPHKDIERSQDLPDESRRRLSAGMERQVFGGMGGIEVRGSIERIRTFAWVPGDDRTHAAALVRFWRAF